MDIDEDEVAMEFGLLIGPDKDDVVKVGIYGFSTVLMNWVKVNGDGPDVLPAIPLPDANPTKAQMYEYRMIVEQAEGDSL